MKDAIVTTVALLLLIVGQISGDTHYVSKVGTNTHPYQSWETAADSISKAIDASESGDTVRVGVGTYYEHVIMKKGIALIGAGRDSCVVDIRQSPERDVIIAADSMVIEGFHVIGRDSNGGVGIIDNRVEVRYDRIANNTITNCYTGILSLNWLDTTIVHQISDNIFMDNYRGMRIDNVGITIIANNHFIGNGRAIYGQWGKPFILNNDIRNTEARAIEWYGSRAALIVNNLVVNAEMGGLSIGNAAGLMVENNTISDGAQRGVGIGGVDFSMVNNIIARHGMEGVVLGSSVSSFTYNNVWANAGNDIQADSVEDNISVDPMFVGNGDYHLQYGSPCIDAGDPNILDVDGSRSDLGVYGGPGGESYEYLDLPPSKPMNAFFVFDGSNVILTWGESTESDFSHNDIYRGTESGFLPGEGNRIASVTNPPFNDLAIEIGPLYFYQITAWDRTGHQSEPSEEIMVATTSVEDTASDDETIPTSYRLLQNHPNPFNAQTVIRYEIPDGRYQLSTSIIIFDILGRRVTTLVEEVQGVGSYHAIWDGRNENGEEVASGIYLCQLRCGSERHVMRMFLVK